MSDMNPPAEESEPQLTPQVTGSSRPPRGVEDLPPVEPPSAGFIVQLFLIPMLIVGAIVGVYALFGRLAGGEQDWRTLVTELRNTNEHRRWRAANGLAQLLKADQDRGEEGQQLARNPEIAKALIDVLKEERTHDKERSREQSLNHQQYLVTALGLLDQPKTVIPPLQEVLVSETEQDGGVRLEALRSISLIANRTAERAKAENRPLLLESLVGIPDLVDDVINVSQEPKPLSRQMGAFVLGLLPSPASRQRLEVMLNDSDDKVRVNAAIGLSRQSSTAGWLVFVEVLNQADDQENRQEGMELVILKNSLKAIQDLSTQWTNEQKQKLVSLLESISDNHPEIRIRTDAAKTLQSLRGSS